MLTASIFSKLSAAARPRRAPRVPDWFSVKHGWLVPLLALQGACSLLIEVDDGDDDVAGDAALGGASNAPDAGPATGGTSGAGLAGAGGSGVFGGAAGRAGAGGESALATEADAGLLEPDAGPGGPDADSVPVPPTFDLAFIEDPEEADATLQLVSTPLALAPRPELGPEWRLSLRPADQVGDVLDFAWSPDGERIAARYATLRGNQVAIFAAPDWHELARVEAGSAATLPELEATANYRWSPSSDALAVELSGAGGPMLGGYVIDGDGAFGLPPVAFTGPIETMDWRSSTSLYVIQPEDDEPELIELRLNQRSFEPPEPVLAIGLFFPLDLRRVPGGVVASSDDETNFLFFWPEAPEAGAEAAFLPSSYLSAGQSFVAEVDDTPEALIYPIGDSASFIDTVPDCPTVLAWVNGSDRRSLAGSKLACLVLEGATAKLTLHSYDADGSRRSTTLDDETLSSELAATENWEGHARGFSANGEFLALASAGHDVLIDLRAEPPSFQLSDSAAQGNTARAFSPSGRALLAQRGRRVDFVVLASTPGLPAESYSLPEASVDLPPCLTAHHAVDSCDAPSAARRAAARWSLGSDVAAMPAAGEGLRLLAAVREPPSVRRVPVSSCGAACVTQYEFGR